VQIALQRKSQRAADGGEFEQAHVAEFRLAEPEIAKTEGQIDIRRAPSGARSRCRRG
jgi:hypothetical protein